MPLGSIALRVGLASALAGAAAAAQTARLGALVARRARSTGAVGRAASTGCRRRPAAGLTFGLSYAAAFQAVRPEVYALSALLVITAAYEVARYDETGDRRRLLTAALAAGLALSNHHLLALTFVVPAALAVRAGAPAGARAGRALAVAAGSVAAVWAYLPLRAARHPLVDWGAPTTLARIWWTVSARAFQKAVARGQVGDVGSVAAALAAELWLVGALLALGGAYVLVRLGRRRLALLLLAARAVRRGDAGAGRLRSGQPRRLRLPRGGGRAAGGARLRADRRAGRRLGAARRACAAARWRLCARRRRRRWRRRRARALLARAASGTPASRSAASSTPRRRARGSSTSDFQTIFALWYLAAVEGRRPDVDDRASPLSRLSRAIATRSRAPLSRDVSREPDVVEYDLDLPAPLLARSTTIPVRAGDRRRAADAALRRVAGLPRRRPRLPHRPAQPPRRRSARARALLSLPALNCDHLRDPVTIEPP